MCDILFMLLLSNAIYLQNINEKLKNSLLFLERCKIIINVLRLIKYYDLIT